MRIWLLSILCCFISTINAQDLTGTSELGEYTISLNPYRGIKGASYLNFKSVGNEIRLKTVKNQELETIYLTLKSEEILAFTVLPSQQLQLKTTTAHEPWPHLFDQNKLMSYASKKHTYAKDSYQKVAEIFAELLNPVYKKMTHGSLVYKTGNGMIWQKETILVGELKSGKVNGAVKLYDAVSDILFLNCSNYSGGTCNGEGEFYDYTTGQKIYQGSIANGKFNGQGTSWPSDDTEYIGHFVDDLKHGDFTIIKQPNDKELGFTGKGKVINNVIAGLWTFTYSDGMVKEMIFVDGKISESKVLKEGKKAPTAKAPLNGKKPDVKMKYDALEYADDLPHTRSAPYLPFDGRYAGMPLLTLIGRHYSDPAIQNWVNQSGFKFIFHDSFEAANGGLIRVKNDNHGIELAFRNGILFSMDFELNKFKEILPYAVTQDKSSLDNNDYLEFLEVDKDRKYSFKFSKSNTLRFEVYQGKVHHMEMYTNNY